MPLTICLLLLQSLDLEYQQGSGFANPMFEPGGEAPNTSRPLDVPMAELPAPLQTSSRPQSLSGFKPSSDDTGKDTQKLVERDGDDF